jgi:amino acid adenylation domain-containing protein/non-ribosomal peptide synthase protein (TIGR01720 family)
MKDHDVRAMVHAAVERFPAQTALRSGAQTLSYAELAARSDRLAGAVAGAGGRRGSRVGIFSREPLELVPAILGVLEAGCAFVPFDPRTPARRLAAMGELVSPVCFLVGAGLAPALAEIPAAAGVPALPLGEDGRAAAAGASGAVSPPVEMAPDDLCYVYFTSGSSGQPKGIAGRFKSIAHFIRWEIETLGVAPGWRVSQLTAPVFDAFLRDMFVPLCAGGTVCAPPKDDTIADAAELARWLAEEEIALVHCVPSLLRSLLHVPDPPPLPALRYVLVAGEPLLPADVRRWIELHGTAARLVNLYGPSETTMTKFVYFVEPADASRRSIPIGQPMPGARALVLDARGKACPTRGIGEILIRTPFRSLGYFARPDLTAEVFVRNPFSADPQDLVYKTGDLGRVMEDGNFEFLGRRDDQVKIRGVRIELAEIESVLLTHPGVREVAVVDREDETGTKFLCAYLVPEPGGAIAGLRDFLAGFLAGPWLPAAFVVLESLPRTLSGKVDRRSLPPPEAVWSRRSSLATPRSGVEEVLTGIFSEVLGVERLGVDDSFFELGGHSLLATQLLSRVRATFGLEVSLRSLFAAPTVAGLASALAALWQSGGGTPPPPLAAGMREEPLPLSFAQERLWFLSALQPGGAAYNIPLAVRLQGRLRRHEWDQALGEIVRRHEALRTTFPAADGQPVQVISSVAGWTTREADLGHLPESLRHTEAAACLRRESRRGFDLASGPLVRLLLLRLGEEDHIALLTLHHIVCDAWSLGVLVRELTVLYGDLVAGGPLPLAEPTLHYADFACWQRRWLAGEVMARQLGYWRRRLQPEAEPLQLPTDRPRAPSPTFCASRRWLRLDPAAAARLTTLARGSQATLFMTLLACFQALLYRYTGQRQISVGSPIANRQRAEIEGLIGFFVNTLVLRADIAPEQTFAALLAATRELTLGAYAHQDLPFEKLVEELEPPRDLGRTPLFQVLFVLQNAPLPGLQLPGLTVTPVELEPAAARFDLTLTAAEEGGGLTFAFEYAAELFDAPTVARLARHYEALAAGAAAAPARRLAELPLVTPAEIHQLVWEWSDTAAGFRAPGTLHGLVAEQARRTPGAVALSAAGESLTYGELAEAASRLARRLRGLGIGVDSLVGVAVERSPQMVVALLAVLAAGGAYVPLDPDYPRDRLLYMAADAGVALLIGDRAALARLGEVGAPVLCLDGPGEAIPPPTAAAHGGRAPAGEDLAYVIYTSGSTGRPKGALNTHRAICNRLLWMQEAYGLTATDRVLHKTPLSFDVSVWEVFWPLTTGATLVLARPGGHRDPAYLAELIAQEAVTTVHFVPSLLQLFLEEAAVERATALRRVICSGEALAPALERRFFALLPPPVELHNLYGPTEAAVDVTRWACRRGSCAPAVPIGRPIANTVIRLLGRDGELAPAGVAAELCIGGVQLARGYHRRPRLTAERFVPDPAGDEPGARLYRTGDLARYRADGEIDFLGRIDQQVKVRGQRVELGEVEAALAAHPAVGAAAVALAGDILVAYVVAAGDGPPGLAELRRRLAATLPEVMLPGRLVLLPALPLTASGKVDRRALARHASPLPEPQAGAGTPPRSATEELLAALWSELLSRTPVARQDSFFALGGHSLLAVRLVSRLRRLFAVELPLRSVFECPTLAELAARVEAARGGDSEGPRLLPPLRRVARTGELRLSFAQERLWFLAQLAPEDPSYNMPVALRLDGELSLPALAAALAATALRHETLRTTFATVAGRAVQVVAADACLPLTLVDLAALPPARREAAAPALRRAEARRRFDLARDPLLRFRLLRLEARRHIALLTAHHAVSDGWSMGVLVRDLGAFYRAAAGGETAALPELPIQYADYAAWQRGWLRGEVLAERLAYWRRRLAALPPVLRLPLDRPRPAVATSRSAVLPFALPPEPTAALRRLGREHGATLFMTVLTAWQVLLCRHAGDPDVSVGVPVAGRSHPETEDLVGLFVNTLVMRHQLTADATVGDLLHRTRESMLDDQRHGDLPFEKLVDELSPQRTLSHAPLFQVMLAFQNTPLHRLELPALDLTPLPTATGATKFDLTLMLEEAGQGMDGSLAYAADLFDPATARRLLGHLSGLLASFSAAPRSRAVELSLLMPGERAQLLVEWNDTSRRGGSPGACLHELFAAQVERTPDAVAVRYEDELLTYGELDRRANRLAQRLSALGVGPEVRVGLCAEPSLALIAGVLGILAAGGAYLPLEPAWPLERLFFMLRDAGAAVVLAPEALAGGLSAGGAEVVALDREAPAGRTARPPRRALPGNLAYVLYTSGSTGRPKGVAVEHRQVVNYCCAILDLLRPAPASGFAMVQPLTVDSSVTALYPPLLTGGCLHLIARDRALAAPTLASYFAREHVDALKIAPSHLAALGAAVPADRLLPRRWLIIGGEASRRDWAAALQRLDPRCAVFNHYGPTEATVGMLMHPVASGGGGSASPNLPLGRPLAGCHAYILDPWLAPVPLGVAGELAIGGACVARGYVGRPELTADRFVADPYGVPGARLYRTGDVARHTPDGSIEFLGRVDGQVKIRGFRIELGEIEAALRGHPAVREAVVSDWESEPGLKRLAAYVVVEPASGTACTSADLRAYLRERLPEFMVPARFVWLASLPRTAHGKIDRRALPAPQAAGHEPPAAAEPAATSAERQLAAIWSEVLRVERVGRHDNFFHLGGDSILSIQIVSRANRVGLHLTVRQIFEHQTVAELAALAGAAPRHAAEQGAVTGDVPLTPVQRRFFDPEPAEPHHYNQCLLLELDQPLDGGVLRRALAHLLAHHDALRLRFVSEPPAWRQYAAPPDGAAPSTVLDLAALPSAVRGEVVASGAAALQASLDLGKGPLLRAALFHLGGELPPRLLLIAHHLVVDGVSWRILLEDLQTACAQLAQGEAIQVPAKTSSFKGWAEGLCEVAGSPAVRGQLAYWSALPTHGLPRLPGDLAGGPNTVASAAAVVVELGREETAALLHDLPQACRTQINDVLLTALALAFAGWTGERRLLIDLEGHGREEILAGVDTSRTVGWFTTVSPLLLTLEDAGSPAAALTSVKRQLRDVPERGIGYGLLRYLCPEAAGALPPLAPEVSFNYLGQLDPAVAGASFREARESPGPVRSPRQLRRHALELNSRILGGRLQATFLYSTNLHRHATIAALAAGYLDQLRRLIALGRTPAEAGELSPADFPLVELSPEQLARAIAQVTVAEV